VRKSLREASLHEVLTWAQSQLMMKGGKAAAKWALSDQKVGLDAKDKHHLAALDYLNSKIDGSETEGYTDDGKVKFVTALYLWGNKKDDDRVPDKSISQDKIKKYLENNISHLPFKAVKAFASNSKAAMAMVGRLTPIVSGDIVGDDVAEFVKRAAINTSIKGAEAVHKAGKMGQRVNRKGQMI